MFKRILLCGLLLALFYPPAWSADSKQGDPSITSKTPVVDRENQDPQPVKAVSPQADQISWYSINGGGVLNSSSAGVHRVSGSLGQTGIGPGVSPGYKVKLGYWPGACEARPGDANASGTYTLGDVISIVNYIFNKPGCAPQPTCWLSGLLCRGDWNASNSVTLGDVIQGVNFIFNKPGGPWNALPVGVCCLP